MPFPSAPKCGRCSKSVYAAEEAIGAGKKWHQTCFKCKICNNSLDSTKCADRDGEIYCKSCYGREFGPKGYGYGGGAGTLSMDTNTSNVSNNHPSCNNESKNCSNESFNSNQCCNENKDSS